MFDPEEELKEDGEREKWRVTQGSDWGSLVGVVKKMNQFLFCGILDFYSIYCFLNRICCCVIGLGPCYS